MKFNYITKGIIPALAVVLSLSSCLKDDNINQDFENLTPMVGFVDASPSGISPNSTGLGVVSDAETVPFNLTIEYMSSADNGGTEVTVAVDEDALEELNDARGTDYVLLTPSNYSIANTKVTIPAGSKTVSFPISILPTTISDPTKAYALPLKIVGATGGAEVSGNFGRHVILVTIKNPYDGVYTATGQFIHPTAGPRDIDQDKTLATIDQTTVETTVGDLTNLMRLRVNADNSVTVIGEISATQPLEPIPGETNTYDPATHTFHLNYRYSGTGGNRVVHETLVRQ
ncbi:MAG: DUF1735 domain-containing protein [Sphingobacteriaceae bacterium]|nr:MAG: DUF1735 domain-containing protein [Sphingobacteriaceae bacterium]